MNGDNSFDAPQEYPIDGVLDLHTFHPRDMKEVVLAYIEACHEKGISDLRIIHGKGMGVQRDKVHSLLRNHPLVISWGPGGHGGGEWGATVVRISCAD